jgi:hypothetical protein
MHVHNICNKANSTIGFLKRNLNIANKSVKERAYQSLVRPFLEYSSARMDVLHDGMLNARVLQFLDGLWSGISLSLVSTFVRFFVILYIIVSREFVLRLSCRTSIRKESFYPRTTKDWNALKDASVGAPSLEAFKVCLCQ